MTDELTVNHSILNCSTETATAEFRQKSIKIIRNKTASQLVCYVTSVADANSTKFTAFENFQGVHETFSINCQEFKLCVTLGDN